MKISEDENPDNREKATNHQVPSVVTPTVGSGVVADIDRRLSAGTAVEAAQWTQVRNAVIEQDQYVLDRQHQRSGELLSLRGRLGMSGGAFLVGAGLVIGGITLPGIFCLGAALYTIAPDYVMMVAKNFRTTGGDNDEF